MLTRRGFLGLLGGAAAVELVKPVSYFFAPKGGWTREENADLFLPNYALKPSHYEYFYDGQHIQIYAPSGGIAKGSAVIQSVDHLTGTIWLENPVNAQPGDYMLGYQKDYAGIVERI